MRDPALTEPVINYAFAIYEAWAESPDRAYALFPGLGMALEKLDPERTAHAFQRGIATTSTRPVCQTCGAILVEVNDHIRNSGSNKTVTSTTRICPNGHHPQD